jgi:hypothetical protein
LTENPQKPKTSIVPDFWKQRPIQRFHLFIPAPEKNFHKKFFRIFPQREKKFYNPKKFPEIFLRNSGKSGKNCKKISDIKKLFQKKISVS